MSIQPTYLLASWGLTSSTWLVLWSALAAITILLVVLLRTRWSDAQPMHKCAILSLWVHVLLAVAATTVHIMSGAPETGSNTPIRVSVIPAMPVDNDEPVEKEITPAWEQPQEVAMVSPEPAPAEPPEPQLLETGPDVAALKQVVETATEPQEPAPPLEAPSLLAAPPEAAVVETEPEQTDTKIAEETQASPEPDVAAAEPSVETELTEADTHTETPTPNEIAKAAPPPPNELQPTLPSTYVDRFAKNRDQLAEQRGGSVQTEQAVRAALGWLADAQSRNGGWDASRFGAGNERVVLGQNRHRAGANADMGITGLALLAFLGAGHTHQGGPYAKEVANALEYLRQRQRANGSLYGEAQLFARMYCHSMATFAVCEAYALTGDSRLEPMANAAVRYALSMQHPTDGGWRYQYGHKGDTSQLGWQLMALKSAQLANLHVPAVTWTRVERFLRRVKRGSAGGLAAYLPSGPPSRTMTAEALFCRQLLQGQEFLNRNSAAALEATQSISQELPTAKHRNLYFWYYATLALHRNQHQSANAAAAWQDWNHALTTTLLATQQDDGSWSEATVWGGYGGKVYTTALSAMCLEVYYRYTPAEGPSDLAGRKGWNSVKR